MIFLIRRKTSKQQILLLARDPEALALDKFTEKISDVVSESTIKEFLLSC